jgi:hypothetical protein
LAIAFRRNAGDELAEDPFNVRSLSGLKLTLTRRDSSTAQ